MVLSTKILDNVDKELVRPIVAALRIREEEKTGNPSCSSISLSLSRDSSTTEFIAVEVSWDLKGVRCLKVPRSEGF